MGLLCSRAGPLPALAQLLASLTLDLAVQTALVSCLTARQINMLPSRAVAGSGVASGQQLESGYGARTEALIEFRALHVGATLACMHLGL